jgi:hypothetical protein
MEKGMKAEPSMCEQLHRYFNSFKRPDCKAIKGLGFRNGIYVMFEKNERYKELDRIVRVGTHNKDERLLERLRDHYFHPNKDGSIFRKNIGKAILNKRNDPYLEKWTLNSSKPEIKSKLTENELITQKKIEIEVSEYIQNNITFICFEVVKETDRLRMEEGIIAALYQERSFRGSFGWLGLYSPEKLIHDSGLWLKQGLDAKPLTPKEFENIKNGYYSSEIN